MTQEKEKERVQLQLRGPDKGALTNIVRQVLGNQTVDLTDWRMDLVGTSKGPATGGVYRVTGSILDYEREATWSVILKVISFRTPGAQPAFQDESHPLYWKREALAYRSGLLNDLPGGLRTPRCYGVVEIDADTIWLWLEEVRDECASGWTMEQYARAAECLGRFNGAYLVERSIPAYPWLVRSGSPRGLLEHNQWIRDLVADPVTWQHPLVRSVFPIPVADRLLRLWDEREMLLRALDRVQHTLGHLDAWRGNMFAPFASEGATGSQRFVLIDWAFPGQAALGTDAGDLFAGSYYLSELSDAEPRLLDQAIFEGYIAGLQDAGWRGNVRSVRFAFAAFCALKYGCFLAWLRDVPDEHLHPPWERKSNLPFASLAHQQARLVYYLLDLADEARAIMA